MKQASIVLLLLSGMLLFVWAGVDYAGNVRSEAARSVAALDAAHARGQVELDRLLVENEQAQFDRDEQQGKPASVLNAENRSIEELQQTVLLDMQAADASNVAQLGDDSDGVLDPVRSKIVFGIALCAVALLLQLATRSRVMAPA